MKNCVFNYNTVSTDDEIKIENNEVKLYPNIVSNQFTVESQLGGCNISVYDINGALHGSTESEKSHTTILTEHLPNGIYFVHVTNKSNKKKQVFKIVKQ